MDARLQIEAAATLVENMQVFEEAVGLINDFLDPLLAEAQKVSLKNCLDKIPAELNAVFNEDTDEILIKLNEDETQSVVVCIGEDGGNQSAFPVSSLVGVLGKSQYLWVCFSKNGKIAEKKTVWTRAQAKNPDAMQRIRNAGLSQHETLGWWAVEINMEPAKLANLIRAEKVEEIYRSAEEKIEFFIKSFPDFVALFNAYNLEESGNA